MFDVIKEILISEKEFTETNYKRLQKALVDIEDNLIDSAAGKIRPFYDESGRMCKILFANDDIMRQNI